MKVYDAKRGGNEATAGQNPRLGGAGSQRQRVFRQTGMVGQSMLASKSKQWDFGRGGGFRPQSLMVRRHSTVKDHTGSGGAISDGSRASGNLSHLP